jgi:hypothetical protein
LAPEIALLSTLRFLSNDHLFATFNGTCRAFTQLGAVIFETRAMAQAALPGPACAEAIGA